MNPFSLRDRLAEVRGRLAASAQRSGRAPGEVTLIGVIKTLPTEIVAEAVGLGLTDLGENRVQEAEAHQLGVARHAARWHMIGHLQRNKAGKALSLFDLVHGVDDADVAGTLDRRAEAVSRVLPVLIEVNVSGEASKFGVAPEGLASLADRMRVMPHLELRGLMTVGAPVERAEDARPGFARLRDVRDALAGRIGLPLAELSMGMSGDFEVAVEEGATLVRVGSAIFGSRPPAAR